MSRPEFGCEWEASSPHIGAKCGSCAAIRSRISLIRATLALASTVIALANEFQPGPKPDAPAIWVGRLTEADVNDACRRYGDVQRLTNKAANETDRTVYNTPAKYGTEVHKKLQISVNGHDSPKLPPQDDNFKAELSLLKGKEEGYGAKGTRRVDVFENPQNGTVCIYDIKTGKSGLSFARAAELASKASHYYNGTRRIIVMEVRPVR